MNTTCQKNSAIKRGLFTDGVGDGVVVTAFLSHATLEGA